MDQSVASGNKSLPVSAAALAELRRLELRTKRSIDADFMGSYRSAFRGTGLVFSDLREYQPGDEVKNIDWKVSARTNRVYVKSYEEDRQLNIILAVDISNSTSVGASPSPNSLSDRKSKQDKALEFAALIAVLAQKNHDALGLCLFSSEIHQFFPPQRSRSQFHRMLRCLMETRTLPRKTDLSNALGYLLKQQRRNALIFVISDFISPPFEEELKLLSMHHDVICVLLEDLLDAEIPARGIIALTDTEGNRSQLLDMRHEPTRTRLKQIHEQRVAGISALSRKCQADFIRVLDNPIRPLSCLMQQRTSKRR